MNFDEYQKQAMTTALNPNRDISALYYRALGLTSEAGEVANKVKKVLRDKDGKLTEKDKELIASELGDVLWYTQALADFLEIPLSQIAKQNLEKLFDRKTRGIIGGSGDNR